MSEIKYLLDTSAVLTFLEDEEGAEQVETLLRHKQVLIPYLVLLETCYITLQERSDDVAARRYALLKQLDVTFLWEIDEQTLLTAAQLKARYHLSLADAQIAAYALRNGAILVHQDPEFEAISEIGQQKALPCKQ